MWSKPGANLPEGVLETWKLAAVYLPFFLALLLAGANSSIFDSLDRFIQGVGLLLLALLVMIWVAGLVRGMPLWALPALGLLLYFFGFYIVRFFAAAGVQAVASLPWMPPLPGTLLPDVLQRLLAEVIFVGGLLLVLWLLQRLVPAFAGRVRQEGTLLSLLVYGMTLPALFMQDPYSGLASSRISAALLLTLGVSLYLVAPTRSLRLGALVLPALLAGLIHALGIYLVYPAQDFARPELAPRIWGALQPVLELPALAALLILPGIRPGEPATEPPDSPPVLLDSD
jgi:hypothetical protein